MTEIILLDLAFAGIAFLTVAVAGWAILDLLNW